jgi:hypothetical protein
VTYNAFFVLDGKIVDVVLHYSIIEKEADEYQA